MRTPYRFAKRLNYGLVALVHPAHGQQLWSTGKVRGKAKDCDGCGMAVSTGEIAYRPLTNALNRGERLCVGCVERLGKTAAPPPPVATASAESCFHCKQPCTSDNFCYGCKSFVCNDCGVESPMGFGHDPEDHLAEDE